MSILPGYCDKFVPECEVGILPSTLSSLFNEEFLELSYLELLKKCEESYNSYRTAGKLSILSKPLGAKLVPKHGSSIELVM